MSPEDHSQSPVKDPFEALDKSAQDAVLAVITRVEGPSYRPLGACMALFADGQRVGSLSSGCIESDLQLQADKALAAGKPATVLYGQGSPFIDIQLPCGGGLEILLVPRPDRQALNALRRNREERVACTLAIDIATGDLSVEENGATRAESEQFFVRIEPEIFFYVFGKGPEASTFAGLVQAAGYPNVLVSPDTETIELAKKSGCETEHMKGPLFPAKFRPDCWSAVVLFFHDHEWEPPILATALETEAFYIGAQGSQRARDARLLEMRHLGVSEAKLDSLKGPIGLVPSARDARTLAVSVLAEVLSS